MRISDQVNMPIGNLSTNGAKSKASGDMISSKFDPVSRNAIWKEHCRKEASKLKLSDHFSINPATLVYLAEKPTRYKPSITVTHEEVEESRNLLNDVCISSVMDIAPTEKYEVPQTSSQEYGWCSRPLVETDPTFNYPHRKCSITTFAAKYVESMHKSPFAKRNPVDQHVAKSGARDYAHAGVNTSRVGSPSSIQASTINPASPKK